MNYKSLFLWTLSISLIFHIINEFFIDTKYLSYFPHYKRIQINKECNVKTLTGSPFDYFTTLGNFALFLFEFSFNFYITIFNLLNNNNKINMMTRTNVPRRVYNLLLVGVQKRLNSLCLLEKIYLEGKPKKVVFTDVPPIRVDLFQDKDKILQPFSVFYSDRIQARVTIARSGFLISISFKYSYDVRDQEEENEFGVAFRYRNIIEERVELIDGVSFSYKRLLYPLYTQTLNSKNDVVIEAIALFSHKEPVVLEELGGSKISELVAHLEATSDSSI